MTESEFKRLFEKHAENIVREIITPIENKIRAQIHDVDTTLSEIDKKIKAVSARQTKLTRSLTKQTKWIERVDQRSDEILKEPIKMELINKIDRFYYELRESLHAAKDDLESHKESLMDMSMQPYIQQFEHRCVAYMQAVERKIQALNATEPSPVC